MVGPWHGDDYRKHWSVETKNEEEEEEEEKPVAVVVVVVVMGNLSHPSGRLIWTRMSSNGSIRTDGQPLDAYLLSETVASFLNAMNVRWLISKELAEFLVFFIDPGRREEFDIKFRI